MADTLLQDTVAATVAPASLLYTKRFCVQADSSKAAGRIGILQNLAQDFRGSRIVWSELLGTVAQSLDTAEESLDPTEEAGATMGQLHALCVEAAVSLAKHAQRLLEANMQDGHQTGAEHSVWRAECAAAEAISRCMQLQMSRGDTVHAVQLVQAACEWFSCPRMSCAVLWSLS